MTDDDDLEPVWTAEMRTSGLCYVVSPDGLRRIPIPLRRPNRASRKWAYRVAAGLAAQMNGSSQLGAVG